MALLGAAWFSQFRGLDNNIYMQIGLVLLIGLVAKTAILIVEFAKSEHEDGLSIIDAAQKAAQLRFRADPDDRLQFHPRRDPPGVRERRRRARAGCPWARRCSGEC